MGDIIKLGNLCHTYTDHEGNLVHALEQVNMTVSRGEFVAVIGTNGSGKSTLAKHLNALLLPTDGKCIVNDLDTSQDENLWAISPTVIPVTVCVSVLSSGSTSLSTDGNPPARYRSYTV